VKQQVKKDEFDLDDIDFSGSYGKGL